ncbi:DUF1345 domain-containing protein [Antrihabitans stalactiti]|uniref:DUF1345 domain-containing protein n=1 Tax=Antrihabitans stalactiti TaxID=2584121 RepID=A0A848KR00_9NOCA|nr:DUF1345 domain-containing protein [Antrihabitans stalactiti]NMN98037.1 DUF1345 domain-containing protein [Antrihabitans stalactiti]
MRQRVLWTLEFSLTGLGIIWLVLLVFKVYTGFGLMLSWDVLVGVYVVLGWHSLRGELQVDRAAQLSELVGPRWYTAVLAVVASSAGLAGGFVMISATGSNPTEEGVAAATVLLSWLLLHTTFAQIYARACLDSGGLQFPECPNPQLAEFVYFSFTIGTTFAVSDVTVVTSRMRNRVTAHSVLSFFFNAAVVAIAIDWLKS